MNIKKKTTVGELMEQIENSLIRKWIYEYWSFNVTWKKIDSSYVSLNSNVYGWRIVDLKDHSVVQIWTEASDLLEHELESKPVIEEEME